MNNFSFNFDFSKKMILYQIKEKSKNKEALILNAFFFEEQ